MIVAAAVSAPISKRMIGVDVLPASILLAGVHRVTNNMHISNAQFFKSVNTDPSCLECTPRDHVCLKLLDGYTRGNPLSIRVKEFFLIVSYRPCACGVYVLQNKTNLSSLQTRRNGNSSSTNKCTVVASDRPYHGWTVGRWHRERHNYCVGWAFSSANPRACARSPFPGRHAAGISACVRRSIFYTHTQSMNCFFTSFKLPPVQ